MESASEDSADVWADCYILMCLDALNDKAEERLRKTLDGAPQKITPEEWRELFENSLSIAADLEPAIVSLWHDQKRADPQLTPERFAQRNRQEIFHDVLYS